MRCQKIQVGCRGSVVHLQHGLDVEEGYHTRKELAVVGESLLLIRDVKRVRDRMTQCSTPGICFFLTSYLQDFDFTTRAVFDGSVQAVSEGGGV